MVVPGAWVESVEIGGGSAEGGARKLVGSGELGGIGGFSRFRGLGCGSGESSGCSKVAYRRPEVNDLKFR